MSDMTREKAIKMLKAKLECLTRYVSGTDDDCNHNRCGECHLNYEQGTMGEQKEYLRMSIEALEQESCENCIKIPEGATNGEMIKALFPNCVIDEDFGGAVITDIDDGQYWRKSWWNSPYRKEQE